MPTPNVALTGTSVPASCGWDVGRPLSCDPRKPLEANSGQNNAAMSRRCSPRPDHVIGTVVSGANAPPSAKLERTHQWNCGVEADNPVLDRQSNRPSRRSVDWQFVSGMNEGIYSDRLAIDPVLPQRIELVGRRSPQKKTSTGTHASATSCGPVATCGTARE